MSELIVYCVDIDVYDPSIPGVVTLHYADVGGVYGGVYYAGRLKQPGNFTTNLFQPGTTSGSSQVGYGELVLINADGALDNLIDCGFDGRTLVFKLFSVISGLVLITSCTMEQPTFAAAEVSIRMKDNSAKLNVPIQPTKYAGTNSLPNGIEGVDDIKGSPKPLTFGTAYNVTPICVNTSKLIYQVHTATAIIPNVYDMGVSLSLSAEADYADQTAMEATAPGAGEYRVCSSLGCFRLGSSPAGQITVDVIEGTTAADRTAAQIAKRIALRAITSGEISSADVTALDSANNAEVGIYIKDESTILAALDQVLGSIGAWYTFDINGVLRMARLIVPSGTPDLILTENDYASIERVAANDAGRGVPPYKVNLQYEKNNTVQTSGLAGSVTYSGIPYWDNLSIAEMPATRRRHSSVIYGTYLYAIGGYVSGVPSVSVIRLNLSNPTGAWDDAGVTDLPTTRYGHSSVIYGNYVYVIGGFVSGSTSASVIRLDLSNPTGAWDDAGVTDLPAIRGYHSSVIYGTYLYAIGGYVSGVPSVSVIRLNLSNPTGAWDDAGVTDLPATRYGHPSVIYGNYVYVIGGYVSDSISASVIRLDLTNPTGAWDDAGVTDLPAIRGYHSSVIYGTYLYAIGGNVSGAVSASIIRLDLTNPAGAWDDAGITDLPDIRIETTTEKHKTNLFLIGGYTGVVAKPNTYIYRILIERTDRVWYEKEFRTVIDVDTSVQTTHLLAPEMNVTTLLIDATAAQTECTRLLNLYKVRRDMFQVEAPSSVCAYIQPGKTTKLYSSRYGLSAGKLFVVIGIVIDWEQGKTTLIVWG